MFSAQAAIAIENTRLAIALTRAEEDLTLRSTEVAAAQKAHVAAMVADSFLEEMSKSLVPLRGYTERLKEITGDARVDKYREYIDREMGRLLVHAEDCKLFLDDGFVPAPVQTGVRELMRDLESRVWVECRTSGIAFQADVEADLTVNADRDLMLKALESIFRNSRDAMPDGGTFSVSAQRLAEGRVEITASDTGKGIEADPIELVFEPFYSSGKRHGAGLGLSMARRIVELHQGTLRAANGTAGALGPGGTRNPGGAVFTITLPAA
jgi:signal transduction histidine kinase